MPDINKALLRTKIIHSRELTAIEKRYIERLIERDSSREVLPPAYKQQMLDKFTKRR